jgi:FkbM family methyltransferase
MVKEFFAENNTDEYLRNKFFSDYSQTGTVVEVGAATPEFLSMSRHFKLNNWRAVVIEPNPSFVKAHEEFKNEIYAYACSYENKDNVDFTIVHQNIDKITDHSFSSFSIKDEYVNLNENYLNSLSKTSIQVNQRTLDYIIQEANINKIELLTVDVEGWELDVLKGLTILQPTVVVLENIFKNQEYTEFMNNRGYTLVEHYYLNDIYCVSK